LSSYARSGSGEGPAAGTPPRSDLQKVPLAVPGRDRGIQRVWWTHNLPESEAGLSSGTFYTAWGPCQPSDSRPAGSSKLAAGASATNPLGLIIGCVP
jgi:hypothetical protein